MTADTPKVVSPASLDQANSFGVSAQAAAALQVSRRDHFYHLHELPEYRSGPVMMLGGGSNILFAGDYPGLVIFNRLAGRQVLDATDKHAYVRLQAGENWHESVLWTLQQGLAGLENLSLIPGAVGAAPIQNVGAYGVELADVLDQVEVWDRQRQDWRMLNNKACAFGYRDSIFKRDPERYFVVNITVKLRVKPKLNLRYHGLRDELNAMGLSNPTPLDVSRAVCTIRRRKLPDPARIGNAGSFFKNPVVSPEQAARIGADYPQMPCFGQADGAIKLSAAWLIEQCGWKGYRDGDAGVSERHALVLVNHGCASGASLWDLAQRIRSSIHERFDIRLQPEPVVILPAAKTDTP